MLSPRFSRAARALAYRLLHLRVPWHAYIRLPLSSLPSPLHSALPSRRQQQRPSITTLLRFPAMKLFPILYVGTGLSALTNAAQVVPTDATPQATHADPADPATTTTSAQGLVFDHAYPDTGITVPPPGSFCSECSAWENNCKDRCGGGRACKDFCKCERAKRNLCRYTGVCFRSRSSD